VWSCQQISSSVLEPADERAGGCLQRLDQFAVSVFPPPVCGVWTRVTRCVNVHLYVYIDSQLQVCVSLYVCICECICVCMPTLRVVDQLGIIVHLLASVCCAVGR